MTTFIILLALLIYMLPTLLAGSRWATTTTTIWIINLFAGWTILAWFVCLIMANTAETIKDKELRELQLKNLKANK